MNIDFSKSTGYSSYSCEGEKEPSPPPPSSPVPPSGGIQHRDDANFSLPTYRPPLGDIIEKG